MASESTEQQTASPALGNGDDPVWSFTSGFWRLTGHEPFPWQQALFTDLQSARFPTSCDLPTGLGKTSVIAVWLLALAHHAREGSVGGFPRRLVYVVNRRTVVDQATDDVERMRRALMTRGDLRPMAESLMSLAALPSGAPLAVSTLRGQFADNAEWRRDPALPAVIVGTVDMIGSRLLFGGYGCGFRSRPLHAGFIGQDALLVHDEAHLEPAFQELIAAIEAEQARCSEFARFRVMSLTATPRAADGPTFGLGVADRAHEVVRRRLEAKKGITFAPAESENELPAEIARRALEYKESGQAILIFARRLKHAEAIDRQLCAAGCTVRRLTGTLRGLERDALADRDAVFARFLSNPSAIPQDGTVYLVCTSAGEVGVNISSDHLVSDLTPFDSMAQRLGRVNRFGAADARIDVVYDGAVENDEGNGEAPFEQACMRTLRLLRHLPRRDDARYDASPAALADLPLVDRQAAFTPAPAILPLDDILLDKWALTSIRGQLPGRPPVADWLHGVAEWEPPETYVAWREEVELLTAELLTRYDPEDLLEDYPLKPHELLRSTTDRVFAQLEAIAERSPELRAWTVEPDGRVLVRPLRNLVERNQQKKPVIDLADRTILLPPAAGGLRLDDAGVSSGMLDGDVAFSDAHRALYDVADRWLDESGRPRRRRVWDTDIPPAGMRPVRTIDISPDSGEEREGEGEPSARRYWRWFVWPRSADDDGSRTAREAQDLQAHLESAGMFASAIVSRLGLAESEASAIGLAAGWHDVGKRRHVWQRSIGNFEYPARVWAKSPGTMQSRPFGSLRHELGSLVDVPKFGQFVALPSEVQDLVLHLIAAHHGRARPCFPADEVFDPERPDEVVALAAAEVPRRFARLQRKYGRWGLAYLESLVRAADALASQALHADITSRPAADGAK